MHPKASEITGQFVSEINKKLPGFLEGLYVYGSLAMNDFHPKKSDIDFAAICIQKPDNQQVKILKSIHKYIQKRNRKPNLNGIYLTWNDLGKRENEIDPFPYFYERKMYSAGHFEINPVTWFQIKNFGITIIGKNIQEANFEVSEEDLIQYVHHNMHSYWAKWVEDHSNWLHWKYWAFIYFDRLIEWGILGIARQYYTLKTKKITSKSAAGEYCLKYCPNQFQNILKEAVRIRKNKRGQIYPSKWLRAKEALDFLKYIQNECNRPVENFLL